MILFLNKQTGLPVQSGGKHGQRMRQAMEEKRTMETPASPEPAEGNRRAAGHFGAAPDRNRPNDTKDTVKDLAVQAAPEEMKETKESAEPEETIELPVTEEVNEISEEEDESFYSNPQLTEEVSPDRLLSRVTTLYTHQNQKWYEIIYDLDEGVNSPLNHHRYSSASGLIKLYPAVREGRQFAGWYLDGRRVNYIDPAWEKNIRLTARFQKNITVSFDTGRGSRIEPRLVDDTGRLPLIRAPHRMGYTFTGWFLDPECKLPWKMKESIVEDTTLYAGWRPEHYEVRLNPNGGVIDGERRISFTIDSPSFILPFPRRRGYRFLGWADQRGNLVLIRRSGSFGNMEFTAQWDKSDEEEYRIPGRFFTVLHLDPEQAQNMDETELLNLLEKAEPSDEDGQNE